MKASNESLSVAKTEILRPEIPKAKEIGGDINSAVIQVQLETGLHITPDWWAQNVGNDGDVLTKFDVAYEQLYDQTTQPQPELEFVHHEYDEAVITDLLKDKDPANTAAETQIGQVSVIYVDKEPSLAIEEQVEAGLEALEESLGKDVVDFVFKNMKIIVGEDFSANDEPLRGGRAFPAHRLVILNGSDTQVPLSVVEALPASDGTSQFDQGDWTEELGGDTKSGRVTLVHEFGHIFDAILRQGYYGGDPQVFNKMGAPTKYGRQAAHEDYAESFAYFVLNPDSEKLSPNRRAAIEADIAQIRTELASAQG